MKKIIDLTFSIAEGMTSFPRHWHPAVEIKQLGRIDKEGRETRKLTMGTHTGTHMDAPRHFIKGGKTIDNLPLDIMIGRATLLDFSGRDSQDPLTAKDLKKYLDAQMVDRLILRFDWDRFWGTPGYYTKHPYLTRDAAHYLVERGVKLLGLDTPTPDCPIDVTTEKEDSPVHKILLGSGVVIVEYLCALSQIKTGSFELVVLPLKISGADGCPVRSVAII